MKMLKLFGILLLSLVALAGTAMAADYAVMSLEVNGEAPSNSLHVEPGKTLVVHANVRGLSASDKDVKMKVWLGGYEYDYIHAVSDTFKVQNGVTYSKYLTLELPEDLDTSSNGYTLHVELFDANNVVERTFNLFVEEPRHNLTIQDVVLVPGSQVDAGDVMYVKVRVENMGYKMEEDIAVEVSIPDLGVYQKTYIDELYSRNVDENSQSSNTLYLTLPEDAKTGDYEMNVKLVYDRGHTTTQLTKLIRVNGASAESAESNSLVSIEDGVEDLKVGEEVNYQVLVANMGKSTALYTVEVVNAAAWADVNIEPAMVSVSKDSTGEMLVKLTAVEEGDHQFTVRVKEGDNVVMEKNLSVNVATQSRLSGLSAVWLALGVVLVVIVVLVVVSQLQGDKVTQDDLEDDTYYHPQNL